MNVIDYQINAAKTIVRHPYLPTEMHRRLLVWAAIGLPGEVGEIIEPIKKALFQGEELDKEHLKDEIGDAIWYLNFICVALEISLEEVMERNLDKINKRYPNGFSVQDSIMREKK